MPMFNTKVDERLLHPDWPEARWAIDGLFRYRPLLRYLMELLEHFEALRAMEALSGCPDVIWNGESPNGDTPVHADAQQYFRLLNDKGVGVWLTFTNTVLEDRHLTDPACNRLLDCLDEACGLNGVIVSRDALADHIRGRKPRLRQAASAEKAYAENRDGKVEWYKEMEKRFDRVVVHPNHALAPALMAELDRGKTEIIATDECVYNCASRYRHETLISHYNVGPSAERAAELERILATQCAGGPRLLADERNPSHARSCHLAHREVKAFYDMGFRIFRITGRRKPPARAIWDVLHFVFNPAHGYPFATSWYHQLDQNIRQQYEKLLQAKQAQDLGAPGTPGGVG